MAIPGAEAERSGILREVVKALVRRLSRHLGDAWAVLALVLLAGLALVALGSATFAWLAEEVMEGETRAFDHAILGWMGARGSPRLTDLALNFTALGSGPVVILVVGVAAAFLWGSRHRWSAALLLVSMLGAGSVNALLKASFARPRPEVFPWRTPYAGHSSFPSGHSMTAMVAYATLAYLVVRLERRRALRTLTVAVAALLIGAVGASRVYLGVHYPSDVLGGFAAGLAWAAFCAVGMESLRLLRARRPGIARAEEGVERGA